MAEETAWLGHPALQSVQGVHIEAVGVGILPVRSLHHGLPGMAGRRGERRGGKGEGWDGAEDRARILAQSCTPPKTISSCNV